MQMFYTDYYVPFGEVCTGSQIKRLLRVYARNTVN